MPVALGSYPEQGAVDGVPVGLGRFVDGTSAEGLDELGPGHGGAARNQVEVLPRAPLCDEEPCLGISLHRGPRTAADGEEPVAP